MTKNSDVRPLIQRDVFKKPQKESYGKEDTKDSKTGMGIKKEKGS